jgi:glycosyltransferase involved in cell wall biosynthesis
MLNGRRVVVVMPAYNAASTLEETYREVTAQPVVDLVIVVDDGSQDATAEIARRLPGATVIVHPSNRGYGANQKTCYRAALDAGADIVIMVHADYQYTPKLIPVMAAMIAGGLYQCVLGSRILGGHAVRNGMPWWKYVGNRALTLWSNILMSAKVSEYHTGYRAFSRELLERVPFDANSDDFVFDNQMLAQVLWLGETVAEVSCPTKYFADASSIGFWRSVRYGFGCVRTAIVYRIARFGLLRSRLFPVAQARRSR